MATTTERGNGTDGKRRLQIGRKNGEKTGEPVFLEWLRELPEDQNGRRFETRGDASKPRYYETFSAVDGLITDMRVESRNVMDKPRTFLYVTLDDGNDVFDIEVGDFDGRYSLNLMQRLCREEFDPNKKTRLSPYALAKTENGKLKNYIGVSLYNGADKIETRKADDNFQPAQPTVVEFKGESQYDFQPVAEWLWNYLEPLRKKLPGDAWRVAPQPGPTTQPAATGRTPANAQNAKEVPFPTDDVTSYDEDDLPF